MTSSSTTKTRAREALEKTKSLPAQATADVRRGVTIRRTCHGIPVTRFHYSAIPERDPNLNPAWKRKERKTYTSQASWDREQEIIDNAGGGELVFADTLATYWDKIVISNPEWRPDPRWRIEAGFDHGKTNPTALLRCYIDHEGTMYFCGEYYVPGREVWEHAPALKEMADIRKISAAYADPTIFDATMQQSNQPSQPGKAAERAKSINELYVEQGIQLFSPFHGDRSDISFAERLAVHWSNLDRRQPSVKIVCRNYAEKPVPGLHNWDCPNLLWELMRRRRVKLTAQQMLTRNASEALVAKDEHANDCMKYVLMSHPEPTVKSAREKALEEVRPLIEAGDLTSAMIRYNQQLAVSEEKPVWIGRRTEFIMSRRYRYR
jgi:hypothetical protein